MIISKTESDVFTAIRAYLLVVFTGTAVIRGQDNRVPMPTGPFIVMSPISAERLATNTSTYSSVGGTRTATAPTSITVQIDFYGSASADQAALLGVIFRDEYSTSTLPEWLQPLYCSSTKELPFINGENQQESRWTIDVTFQYNPSASMAQDFAEELSASIFEVNV